MTEGGIDRDKEGCNNLVMTDLFGVEIVANQASINYIEQKVGLCYKYWLLQFGHVFLDDSQAESI